MEKKPSIKSLLAKTLREGKEPFFYLAPDIVGSINNPIRDNNRKIVIIGLNLLGGDQMSLVVPEKCYDKYTKKRGFGKETGWSDRKFVNKFLTNLKPVDDFNDVDDLNEIVDEYGNIFNDSEDLPVNIRSDPGYSNHKSGDQAQRQFISRYQRLISPLGYGGVVW